MKFRFEEKGTTIEGGSSSFIGAKPTEIHPSVELEIPGRKNIGFFHR
jgi:hypothetical protein